MKIFKLGRLGFANEMESFLLSMRPYRSVCQSKLLKELNAGVPVGTAKLKTTCSEIRSRLRQESAWRLQQNTAFER
jgi:hypothetical protein